MGRGRSFYQCRCGEKIVEEWDYYDSVTICNLCNDPIPSTVLPRLLIIGEAGSGKNYVVNIIKELYPGYQSIKIAKPLYDIIDIVREGRIEELFKLLRKMEFKKEQIKDIVNDILAIDSAEFFKEGKPRKLLQQLGDILRKNWIYVNTLDKNLGFFDFHHH